MFENRWYSVPKHFHTTSCNVIFLLHPPNIYLSSPIYIPMGQWPTRDLLLLAISELQKKEIKKNDLEDISYALGRSLITINRVLAELRKDQLIIRLRSKGIKKFILTEKSDVEIDRIKEKLESFYFTPERHSVPASIKLVSVTRIINQPLFRIFLINLYLERNNFDLIDNVKTFELLENETSIYNLLERFQMFQEPTSISNFVHSFMDTTLYGIKETEKDPNLDHCKKNYGVRLIEADMKVSRGSFEEGLSTYNDILKIKDLPQDIWFISSVGKIKTLSKMGRREETYSALEETRSNTNNRMALAYLNQIEADISGMEEDFENTKLLFEKCIGTFRHYNHPIFLSIAHNNYGILMFNQENYQEAEKMWKKARRYALQGGSDYLYAVSQTNLASIMRINGDMTRAKKYLENARKAYETLNLLEKISDVDFNISLIHLSEGEFQEAIDIFNESLFYKFPFLSQKQKEERLRVFERESKKYKYTPHFNGKIFNLIYIG